VAGIGGYLHEKNIVEYTFKNSLSEKVQTIVLSQSYLILQSAGNEEFIPYESIETVKLSRKDKENTFRITLYPQQHTPVSITNKYYLPGGSCEDRSRQYTAFVRNLHYHLKEKGRPVYSSGFSLNVFFAWILSAAFISFFISFISEYLGLSLLDPFIQALILTVVIVAVLFAARHSRLPRTYSPTEIPFQFLP
jgi:hypothetical protein